MTLDTRYFALAVRVIGLFVLARAVPTTCYQLLSVVVSWQQAVSQSAAMGGSVPPSSVWVWSWGPTIAFELLELGAGFYLLAGGGAIARWCIRSCEFQCPHCGYDLRDIKAEKCPECGSVNVLLVSGKDSATSQADTLTR